MNIGKAALASQVSAKMIRHYEALGLIPAPARTAAGYRQYLAQDVQRLVFVKHTRELGFSLQQISALMALWQDQGRASQDVQAIAQKQIALLAQKIKQLQDMQQSLEILVTSCHGDNQPECAILEHLQTIKQ